MPEHVPKDIDDWMHDRIWIFRRPYLLAMARVRVDFELSEGVAQCP